ncbi:MAG: hypothetical protein CHACPFDD_01829 [Phycisphaerae bacterium]|nr:hypothetical protein [Phycisphaerae bacterium]
MHADSIQFAQPSHAAGFSELAGSSNHVLTRPRRVALLMVGVWILNAFDLGFTGIATALGNFTELNPIAAHLLDTDWTHVMLYKIGLTALGTLIMMRLARHSVAELGCWLLFSAYVYVAVRWYVYYEYWFNETAMLYRFSNM